MSLMTDFMGNSALLNAPDAEPERAELHRLADALPIEKIKKIMNFSSVTTTLYSKRTLDAQEIERIAG